MCLGTRLAVCIFEGSSLKMKASSLLYNGETLARFLIWSFSEFGKDCQIKNLLIYINTSVPMELGIQIAKLKIHKYQLRSLSSTKLSSLEIKRFPPPCLVLSG